MSPLSKFLILVSFSGAIPTGYEAVQRFATRAAIATERRTILALETDIRDARFTLESVRQESIAADERIAAARVQAAADAQSPAARLKALVSALKQLFEAAPEQKIPELRLLEPKDWIASARGIIDTPNLLRVGNAPAGSPHSAEGTMDVSLFSVIRSFLESANPSDVIYDTLAGLRRTARGKFAADAQEALRRFLEASGDQLPADIAQLAPYLAAPADLEMLQRYTMLRDGKWVDGAEKVIVERSSPLETRDQLLRIGLSSAEWKPAVPAPVNDAADALGAAMEKAFADVGLDQVIQRTFGDEAALKRTMAESIAKFTAAHAGQMPADLFELRPFLSAFNDGAFVEGVRPLVAVVTYAVFHDGKFPPDPAAARAYTDEHLDLEKALRSMKLGDDGHSMEFKVGPDD